MDELSIIKAYQKQIASKGGKAVKKKYGKGYFKKLRAKRKNYAKNQSKK